MRHLPNRQIQKDRKEMSGLGTGGRGFLFLIFSPLSLFIFFKVKEIIPCLHTDGNEPIGKWMMQEGEGTK